MDEEEDVTLTEVGHLTSSDYTVSPRKGVQHHVNTHRGSLTRECLLALMSLSILEH